MTDEPLLTLRQVADELGLPESTVRYYRDAFLDHIPSVGTGRRRRYPPPAVAVLRSVAKGYGAGRSREQILGALDGVAPHSAGVAPAEEKARRAHRQPAGISNLELLAAIVDGEREQRDALWQMAKEIVRLTEVLEGQEKVLTEIADHSGVRTLEAGVQRPPRALGEGRAPTPAPAPVAAAVPPPPPPAPPPPFVAPAPPPPPPPAPAPPPPVVIAAPLAPPPIQVPPPMAVPPLFGVEPPPPLMPPPFASPPAASIGAPEPPATAPERIPPSEMERLRAELESERQLVERLREAKVKLEHRVTDAEAALEERRPRKRASVLGRLLKPGEEE